MKYIKTAKKVIESEIEGLKAIENWFDDNFTQAVDLILKAKGRIILSGMGKSGHIANKIAATMASTGTPALFVHPSEASHGDLGMITADDVVILLSNSGETSELKDIIIYCNRFSIPLIGIVRRKTSVLVDAATVALILPETPEASSINAPTTSTTMMLALGDALAISAMESKGFTKDDFGIFHPGGKLGSAFIKIKDLMHKDGELPLIDENAKMSEVLIEMTAKHFGTAGIIDKDGKFKGIITDGDLRRHMSDNLTKHIAKDVMTKNPITTTEDKLASEAISIMQSKKITSLFILKDEKPVGILHIHDILRAGII